MNEQQDRRYVSVFEDDELRQYGEYRTKRLVLEAWERFGYDN